MAATQHFHRPTTLEQARALKLEHGDQAAFLGGGTLLNSLDWPAPPAHLISLAGLGLDTLTVDEEGLLLGATCTLQQLLDDARLPDCLRQGIADVDNRNVRNMATVGGHLAGATSTRDLLPLLIALQATVHMADGTQLALLDYLQAPPAHGLITQVQVPSAGLARAWAIDHHRRAPSATSTVTAAVTVDRDGDKVLDPIIVIGGVADTVIRLTDAEATLHGQPLPDQEQLQALLSKGLLPPTDIYGSAEYKRYIAGALGARTLLRAFHGGDR